MSQAPVQTTRSLDAILADIMTVLLPSEDSRPSPEHFHPFTAAQERSLVPLLKEVHPFEDALVALVRDHQCKEAALVLTLKYWRLANRAYVRYRDGLIVRMRKEGHIALREVVDRSYHVLHQLILSYDPTKKLPLAGWMEAWAGLRIQRELWRLARRSGVVPKSEYSSRGYRAVETDPETNAPVHNLRTYLAANQESRGYLINLLRAEFPNLSERSTFDEIIRTVLRAGKQLEPQVIPRGRKVKPDALPGVNGERVPVVIQQNSILSEFLCTPQARRQIENLKWARENDRRREVFEAVYRPNLPDADDNTVAEQLKISRQYVSRARLRAVELVMESVLAEHQERVKAQIGL
ncbi:MAG TPA: hypothetical protein VD902_17460 [Symbiobacteriaceae bacterium]|nr:hypothetical protein [Symbiobacteriaceae bacterium]